MVGDGNVLRISGGTNDTIKFNDNDGINDNWDSTVNPNGSITFTQDTTNLSFRVVTEDVDVKSIIDIDI